MELIDSIKAAFKGKTVEIIVSDEISSKELRACTGDENSFKFWLAEEENIYQDYYKKKS